MGQPPDYSQVGLISERKLSPEHHLPRLVTTHLSPTTHHATGGADGRVQAWHHDQGVTRLAFNVSLPLPHQPWTLTQDYKDRFPSCYLPTCLLAYLLPYILTNLLTRLPIVTLSLTLTQLSSSQVDIPSMSSIKCPNDWPTAPNLTSKVGDAVSAASAESDVPEIEHAIELIARDSPSALSEALPKVCEIGQTHAKELTPTHALGRQLPSLDSCSPRLLACLPLCLLTLLASSPPRSPCHPSSFLLASWPARVPRLLSYWPPCLPSFPPPCLLASSPPRPHSGCLFPPP